jgi:hypothetical protein
MTPQGPSLSGMPSSAWTTRERILAELVSHGVAVPDLDPSARFVAVARLTADYRPLARAFQRLEGALRWLQQTESQHAVVDVIVDLSAPSLESSVIRPFHVLTADDAREPLDLSTAALGPVPSLGARQPYPAPRGTRRRPGTPRLVE